MQICLVAFAESLERLCGQPFAPPSDVRGLTLCGGLPGLLTPLYKEGNMHDRMSADAEPSTLQYFDWVRFFPSWKSIPHILRYPWSVVYSSRRTTKGIAYLGTCIWPYNSGE